MTSGRSGEGLSDVQESRLEDAGGDPFAQTVSPLGEVPDSEERELASRMERVRAGLFGGTQQAPIIGRYSVLKVLGEGGMGTVYAVFDDQLDRRVALKLVKGTRNEEAHKRMLREAQAMAKLSHPNVVPIFEVGEHGGQLYLAMEYVRGQTLARWREASDPDWEEILDKYIQAGRGLAAAHAEGLVHRDFKPHNAVVGEDGRVRVLDFGLAARDGDPTLDADGIASPAPKERALDTPLTETGTVMGTPAYMPPEQFVAGRVDHRSDQFSLCVALWEALYGKRPFSGGSAGELVQNMANANFEQPASEMGPPSLRPILERGLQASPDARWPDLDALLLQLEGVLQRSRTKVRLWLGLGALVLIPVLAGLIFELRDRAQQARDKEQEAVATRKQLEATEAEAQKNELRWQERVLVESARLELEAGNPMRALAYLVRARDLAPDSAAVHALVRRATDGARMLVDSVAFIEDKAAAWTLFSSDGRFVLTTRRGEVEDNRAFLYAVDPSGKLRLQVELPAKEGRTMLAVAPEQGTVAYGFEDGRVELYDPVSGALRATVSGADVSAPVSVDDELTNEMGRERPVSAGFSLDGNTLVTGGVDGNLRGWDAANGALRFGPTKVERPLSGVSVGKDAITAWDFDGTVVFDARGRVRFRIPGSDSVLVSPDGQFLAALPGLAAIFDSDFAVRVFDPSGKQLASLTSPEGWTNAPSFSADSSMLAVGRESGSVEVWDTQTWTMRHRLAGLQGAVDYVGFGRDDKQLAGTANRDRTIVWDLDSGRRIQSVPVPRSKSVPGDADHGAPDVLGVRFSEDGAYLLTTSNREVLRWETKSADRVAEVPQVDAIGHTPDLSRVFTRQGDRLIEHGERLEPLETFVAREGDDLSLDETASKALIHDDEQVSVWDIKTGDELLVVEGEVREGVLSRDGRYAFVFTEEELVGYRLAEKGSQELFREGHSSLGSDTALVTSDGSRVAYHVRDDELESPQYMVLRDLKDGSVLERQQLERQYSETVPSESGRYLIALGYGGWYDVWDTEGGLSVRQGRERGDSPSPRGSPATTGSLQPRHSGRDSRFGAVQREHGMRC